MARQRSRDNPQAPLNGKELAAVAGVGLVLSWVGSGFGPLLVGTGLYTLGVYIGSRRPDSGWMPTGG